MEQKEKALELVARFDYLDVTSGMKYQDSKICAIICVEEQIKLYEEIMGRGFMKTNAIGLELSELKNEIEKL